MPFILSIIEFYTAFSLQIKVRTFGHKPPEPTEDRSSFPARAVPLAIPLKLLRLTPRSCRSGALSPKRCHVKNRPKRCHVKNPPAPRSVACQRSGCCPDPLRGGKGLQVHGL